MAPSGGGGGGGDATRGDDAAHDDDGKWNKGQTPISPSPVNPSPSDLRQPTSTKGLSGGHDKDYKDGDSAPHKYPDSFQGFSELPFNPAVSKAAIADEELVPPYPNVFEGFAELPANDGESNEKLGFQGFSELPFNPAVSQAAIADEELVPPYPNVFEGFAELPANDGESNEKLGFDDCQGMMNDNEENKSNIDSLKRNFCDDEIELGSQKRIKSDENGTIWAQSPNETYRIAAIIRSIVRMRNNREVQHIRRREVMVAYREDEVKGREIRVRDREIRADEKELKKDEASPAADDDDLEKNSGTVIPADSAAKESPVALNMEKAKEVIEAIDAHVTLADKFLNIPKKSKELVKSFQENKQILKNMYADNKKLVSKFKGYWGAATTTAIQVAKEGLKQAAMEEMGGPGGDDIGAGDDACVETTTDGEANASEQGTPGSAEGLDAVSRAGGEDIAGADAEGLVAGAGVEANASEEVSPGSTEGLDAESRAGGEDVAGAGAGGEANANANANANASEEASAAGHDSDRGKATGRDGDAK